MGCRFTELENTILDLLSGCPMSTHDLYEAMPQTDREEIRDAVRHLRNLECIRKRGKEMSWRGAPVWEVLKCTSTC